MKKFSPLALLACSLLAAGPDVRAQEPREGAFSETVEVKLVNLEAWVTDRKGVSIRGLTQDDFEVFEDGKRVEVSYFAEVRSSRIVPVGPSGEVVPGVANEIPEGVAAQTDPHHLVIYFDQLHTLPSSRTRLIKDLRKFLWEQRVPAERVLILSQAGELVTEATFGSNRQQIDDALSRIAKSGGRGGTASAQKRLAIRGLQDLWETAERLAASSPRSASGQSGACDYFMPRAVNDIEMYMLESGQRISVSLDHLASAASFLTGVPGVKTMLYLSDALESEPGADLAAFANDLCPGYQDSRLFVLAEALSRDFNRLTRHANASRVTIYSMQTSGLSTTFTMGADQRSFEFRGTRSFDMRKRETERGGMVTLAVETGGRTVFNSNRFDRALNNIAHEMESYYSLAYEPLHGGDGGEHQIEVKLKDRDLRVRHRRGYLDKNADTLMAERLQGAVFLGLVDNPLGVRLGSGTVEAVAKKKLSVPLHVIVPVGSVVFLPGESTDMARLSLQIKTQDTRSGEGIFEQQTFEVARPPEDQDLLSMVVRLELPEGVHVVGIGLRDDASRESSFVSTTLELRAGPETQVESGR